jgi:ubiquinone/menaquinone biosynthesis C-methylase UbiE
MEFTGERVVPGKVEPDLFNEHLSRYRFAQPLVKGRLALDLGCGTGYGAAILAESARQVLGLDISKESVAFARGKYVAPNVEFFVSDCNHLAVRSGSIDTVVCMEVIEHLPDQETLMEEVCRVLRPEGILVISTPNRIYYTEERNEVNPFHVREFDFPEFSAFLKSYFEWVEIAFQNHVSSIFIGNTDSNRAIRSQLEHSVVDSERTANYFVAVCSKTAAAPPTYEPFVYLPAAANFLREKDTHIKLLQARERELVEMVRQQQREYDTQNQWCLALNRELQDTQKHYRALDEEFRERTLWAQRLSAEISQKDERIASLQAELEERTARALRLVEECQELRERMASAESLSAEVSQKDERIASLQAELEERTARALRLGLEHWALEQELRERIVWASAENSQRDERIASLEAELNERTAWALRLNEEHRSLGQRIVSLQAEFDERTAWALRLNEELRLNVEKLNTIRKSKLFQLSKGLGLMSKD